jgi:hypothetical protein
MGNFSCRRGQSDPDSAWKIQNQEAATNPMYKYANFSVTDGRLLDAYLKGGTSAVKDMARTEIEPFLCHGGKGLILTKLEYVRWKRRMDAKMAVSIYIYIYFFYFKTDFILYF